MLVYTLDIYYLYVMYLHTLHTIPNNLSIKLSHVAVCPIHLNSFLYQLLNQTFWGSTTLKN
jgi:hypothetical protein